MIFIILSPNFLKVINQATARDPHSFDKKDWSRSLLADIIFLFFQYLESEFTLRLKESYAYNFLFLL